jgi:hypothetical protein
VKADAGGIILSRRKPAKEQGKAGRSAERPELSGRKEIVVVQENRLNDQQGLEMRTISGRADHE